MHATSRPITTTDVPACEWPQDVRRRALTIGRMLRPFKPVGVRKIRVGTSADGGYVMLDDFSGIRAAVSLGIGDNVDWDFEIAEQSLDVHQFDHTVDRPPRSHPNFRFQRRRVAEQKQPDSEDITSILIDIGIADEASAILKMDIEGAEWSVFSLAQESDLAVFSQIICEFHGFEHFASDSLYTTALEALRKLTGLFHVVHVHGNNFVDATMIDGNVLPFCLEVTFANKARYKVGFRRESFPTSLDRPCDPCRPDYFLGRFGLAGSTSPLDLERAIATVRRWFG